MAVFTLTDAVIWADALDLTGVSNKVTVKTMTAEKESTVFGLGGYKARLGGLDDVELNASGFLDYGTGATGQDAQTFAMLGAANKAFTVAPTSTVGSTAFMGQAVPLSYGLLGANVGDMAPYDLVMKGSAQKPALVRGQIAKAKGTQSATGALGAGVNLGVDVSFNWAYVVVHIFPTVGTTITLQLQSDITNLFPGPALLATIGPLTTAGGTFMARVSPGSTSVNTWYRLNCSAITGTFTIAAAIALGL